MADQQHKKVVQVVVVVTTTGSDANGDAGPGNWNLLRRWWWRSKWSTHWNLDAGEDGGSGTCLQFRYKIASTSITAKATGGAVGFYGGKTIHVLYTSTGTFATPGIHLVKLSNTSSCGGWWRWFR